MPVITVVQIIFQIWIAYLSSVYAQAFEITNWQIYFTKKHKEKSPRRHFIVLFTREYSVFIKLVFTFFKKSLSYVEFSTVHCT